ncbi:MAG: hypothetical protein R3F60_06735 [bacterium]
MLGVLASGPAMAIGLCEQVKAVATVRAIGPERVAVDREEEVCDEVDGEEVRKVLKFTEILDQAGNVIARYAAPGTPPEVLKDELSEAKPADGLAEALKAGSLVATAPAAGACTVEAKVVAGHLVAEVRSGKTLVVEHPLTENADPAAPLGEVLKTWWLPGGVLVLQVDMPLVFDQGALGQASGQFSQVLVLGPDGIPGLAACKAAPAAKPAVVPTAAP